MTSVVTNKRNIIRRPNAINSGYIKGAETEFYDPIDYDHEGTEYFDPVNEQYGKKWESIFTVPVPAGTHVKLERYLDITGHHQVGQSDEEKAKNLFSTSARFNSFWGIRTDHMATSRFNTMVASDQTFYHVTPGNPVKLRTSHTWWGETYTKPGAKMYRTGMSHQFK